MPSPKPIAPARRPWRLDDKTRAAGRVGLAQARQALRAARPPPGLGDRPENERGEVPASRWAEPEAA